MVKKGGGRKESAAKNYISFINNAKRMKGKQNLSVIFFFVYLSSSFKVETLNKMKT